MVQDTPGTNDKAGGSSPQVTEDVHQKVQLLQDIWVMTSGISAVLRYLAFFAMFLLTGPEWSRLFKTF